MSRFPKNDDKFNQVRALNLPRGQYAITSSGPLGAREIRELGDIDLVVSDAVWQRLEQKYGAIQEDGFTKVRIGDDIEVLGAGSNFVDRFPGAPTVADQIADSEIINGLPFVSLEHVLYFKSKMNRPKDQTDIESIEALIRT